ncbi:MAG: response regulator [bacterium]|nr:response regulator [bacterium]
MTKRLLLVDDEEFFLNSLKDRLDFFSDIFKTDICYSVDEAIEHIETHRYGIVITDIKMPEKTGIHLLVYLRAIKFKGNVIVMSAYNTEEISRNIKVLGGIEVISKPSKIEGFKNMLLDWFSRTEEERTVTFERINLVTMMQIINMEKKTAALEIHGNGKSGMIYFTDGEITHAECDGREGEEAFSMLVSLKSPAISVKNSRGNVKQSMATPFQKIIMNMIRSIDEEPG